MRVLAFIGRRWFVSSLVLVLLFLGGGAYYWHITRAAPPAHYKTPEEADVYVRFEMEGYDKIQQNYWMKAADADFATLFQLSLGKAAGISTLPALATKDRAGVSAMFAEAFRNASSTEMKKQWAVTTLKIAANNLAPVGHSDLLSTVQETQLRQEVANVKPSVDLYADLGTQKGTSTTAVENAYQEKKAQLEKATTTEAKVELQKVSYAHKVLTNVNNKALYDQAQIQPTVFVHRLGTTLYLFMDRISPTTLQEFGLAIESASSTPGLDSIILDLRGNIGGALDFASYFLGLFVGQNQYAFDFFHQGDYQPQRTPIGKLAELARYREIAILSDNMTQSTAEVVIAMFKRFNLARVVGTATRGWGSVENTIPIETVIDPKEKYSLLLVQYLTLRDDGQPIEGRGVDPDVNTGDKNWRQELPRYFRSQSLIDTLGKVAAQPPLR